MCNFFILLNYLLVERENERGREKMCVESFNSLVYNRKQTYFNVISCVDLERDRNSARRYNDFKTKAKKKLIGKSYNGELCQLQRR